MFKLFTVILSAAKDLLKETDPSLRSAPLRMTNCFVLCIALLFGCQYNMPGMNKKNVPISRQHTSPAQSKQQNAEQAPAVKSTVREDALPTIAKPAAIKVALLLPLSGSYKDLGRGMQDAAQLALFRIGDPRLTLLPIDSKDSPAGAAAAAKEAVSQGAKIILGPIFSSGAKAITQIAAENNIQVVSFSNDASLARSGVFAIGTMPEQQVNRMVNFAIEKGITDFTTILPSDAYGAAVTNELKQTIAGRQGVSILKNEVYQADNQGRIISLDDHVKSVFNAAISGATTAPRAMIIPANTSAMTQILGVISKNNYDKSKIKFLGSDQWNDAAILSNTVLEGSWFTALPRERRRDFEIKFKEIYGYNPPKLCGLAYDGVALAATLARSSNGDTFSRESLTNPRGFIGVDGIFRLQDNGLAERGFAIMSVKGGSAVLIDSAPTSFADSK